MNPGSGDHRSVPPLLSGLRLLWGTVLVVAPGLGLRALGGPDTTGGNDVARVLGGRHMAQATVELGAGGHVGRLGPLIDLTHSLSALALASFDRKWRRAALVDAAIAASFALAGVGIQSPTTPAQTPARGPG